MDKSSCLWLLTFLVNAVVAGSLTAKSVAAAPLQAKEKSSAEAEIIAGCRLGKASAQEQLYQLYARRMMAICMRYTTSRFEAEDIFHEAFVKVFNNIGNFKGEGSFEGWMRRIFVNTAINHFNKNRKFQKTIDYSTVEEVLPATEDIISEMSGKEISQLIDQLPHGYKLIFNLFVVEGYAHQEIGEMLQISEGTSKSQLSKAKAYLKKLIQKHSISEQC